MIDGGEAGAGRTQGDTDTISPPHRAAAAGPPVPAVGYGPLSTWPPARLPAVWQKAWPCPCSPATARGRGAPCPIEARGWVGMDAYAIVMHGLMRRWMGVSKKTRGPSVTQPEVRLWVSSPATAPCLQLVESALDCDVPIGGAWGSDLSTALPRATLITSHERPLKTGSVKRGDLRIVYWLFPPSALPKQRPVRIRSRSCRTVDCDGRTEAIGSDPGARVADMIGTRCCALTRPQTHLAPNHELRALSLGNEAGR